MSGSESFDKPIHFRSNVNIVPLRFASNRKFLRWDQVHNITSVYNIRWIYSEQDDMGKNFLGVVDA